MKKKIFYFSYKSQNGNCYWGFGIDFNVVKAMLSNLAKRLIVAGKYLIDHLFEFIYILCWLGVIISGTLFSEGTNKGWSLISFILCAGFLVFCFLAHKNAKQKNDENDKKWEELFSH